MDNEVSDIEILHAELLTSKSKYSKKVNVADIERNEYFSFMDGLPEHECSVGIFWKNKVDDEY